MVHSSQVALSGLKHGSLLETYRIFMEVVSCRSMSGAAWNLDIDVSVVSRHVAVIERSFACKLFERHRRGVRLTAEGERVSAHVAQVLADEGRLRDELDELRHLRGGAVRIAATEGAIAGPLCEVAARFARLYPGVRIEMFQASSEQVLPTLRRGEAELGAGFEIGDEPGIDIVASHVERVAVVVAPHHPLSGDSEIDMARLKDFPLATSERNSGIMRVLRRLAQRQGVMLEPTLVSNSLHALMRIAESGVGVALASGLSTRDRVRDGKIVVIPLRGEPSPRLTLNVCVLQDRQRSFALTRLIEEIQKVVRELPAA